MSEHLGAASGLAGVAARLGGVPPAHGRVEAVLRAPHEPFCREVADIFETSPALDWTLQVSARYRRYARENLVQYWAARDAGIDIRPWTRPGQPYRNSRELVEGVRRSGVVYVYLTRSGHGPRPGPRFHPLHTRSGVIAGGVEFTHNDVLRAVHDLFGHVLTGHGFGTRGELAAAYTHGRLYTPPARTAMFTEHVGQICWYFHGRHRRAGRCGSGARPYPPQKVFLFPPRHEAALARLFEEESL